MRCRGCAVEKNSDRKRTRVTRGSDPRREQFTGRESDPKIAGLPSSASRGQPSSECQTRARARSPTKRHRAHLACSVGAEPAAQLQAAAKTTRISAVSRGRTRGIQRLRLIHPMGLARWLIVEWLNSPRFHHSRPPGTRVKLGPRRKSTPRMPR